MQRRARRYQSSPWQSWWEPNQYYGRNVTQERACDGHYQQAQLVTTMIVSIQSGLRRLRTRRCDLVRRSLVPAFFVSSKEEESVQHGFDAAVRTQGATWQIVARPVSSGMTCSSCHFLSILSNGMFYHQFHILHLFRFIVQKRQFPTSTRIMIWSKSS